MKKMMVISILVVSLLSARQVFPETSDALSVKAKGYNVLNVDNNTNENTVRNSREEITLFEWDFEGDLWNSDEGWILTDTDYNSESHSYLSPNDDSTLNSSWNVVSDPVALPLLGEGEVMQFDFFVKGDTPDTDGDDDGYLEDYYQLSIMDLNALAWHASENAPDDDDNSYWCADEEIGSGGGYLDEWMQYLDTPSTIVNDGDALDAQIRFEIEAWEGASVGGSCTDGWDAANVRISADGGNTWNLLEDPNNPYHFECGYGWIYNDGEYEEGGSLNHVAAGWGGSSDGWLDFHADLSAWAGQDVIVRFAFGSDPAYSTIDQDDMTGFQVDKIAIGASSYLDDCDDSPDANTMVPSGEVWEGMFYDYFSCEDDRPGACGEWEQYIPGLAFNGNAYHDISHLAGKNVLIKFSSRYDDNDDGGTGAGIFIDDFRIYKESTGGYAAPTGLTAEAGDSVVNLAWNDMNASGTDNFYFHNGAADEGYYMTNEDATGFAGTAFEFAGSSTVHSVEIYRSDADTVGGDDGWPVQDFDMEICAYGTFGSLYDTEKLYVCVEVNTATFETGWNTVDIPEWEMDGNYIISYSFNHYYFGHADFEGNDENSYFSYKLGNGDTAPWQYQSGNAWGITANISYESADVTYSVYDIATSGEGTMIASGLDEASFSDTDVQNDVLYTYAVTATYPDGEESGFSDTASARPESDSVHEEGWDDGSAESGFNSGGSNTYIAVRYEAVPEGEQLKRVKWYQMGAGGAFYLKVWEDDNGIPGNEIFSVVQVSGNVEGWNERNISDEGITVSGDFWFGTKNFSSTQDWGLDTDENSGNSRYNSGSEWDSIDGNLMLRVVLDCGDNCPGDDACSDTIPGDTNGDGITNILDVVSLVNFILGGLELDECGLVAADLNSDGVINILDVVGLVSSILGGRSFDATSAILYETSQGIDITSDGYLGAVELTLSHGLGFELELTQDALVADYKTSGTTTKLIVVAPETDHILSTEDAFEIDEVLAVNSNEFIDVVRHVSEFNLSSAYPNPFNPTTNIDFSVAEAGYASVKVYNLMGQVVGVLIDGMVDADTYNLTWDAQHLSSGVYMIKAESNGQVATQKIMLLK